MNKKTVWLINQYASTPDTGIGGRHYSLARELVRQGNIIYLIAASYSHILREPKKIENTFETKIIEGINFVWIKTLPYPTAHSKKRILNWVLFAWRILFLSKFIENRPEAILYSSPSLFGFLSAKLLAWKFKAKLVFEVRDIWPLSLIELGGYSKKHPFIQLMQLIEDFAYRISNRVVSNLPNAVEHMVARGMDRTKFVWIPNGFSNDEINNQQNLSPDVLSQLPTNKFLIGYTGTIGLANALDTLIQTADLLANEKDVAFVIVGKGKEKPLLERKIIDLGLHNVVFIDPINKIQMQSLLKQFDACYLGWKNDSLYKFGTAANKLIDYLISGKPVIHSYSGSFDIIALSNAGISVPAEDAQAVADAILRLKNLPKSELNKIGQNGKKYAIQHHDYKILSEKLAQILFE